MWGKLNTLLREEQILKTNTHLLKPDEYWKTARNIRFEDGFCYMLKIITFQ